MGDIHLGGKGGKDHIELLLHLGALEIAVGKELLALSGDDDRGFARDILAEELCDVGREHLQYLVIPAEFLLLAHRAVELVAPDIPGDLATEIFNPSGPMKHRALIELGKDSRHRHVRQMLCHPVHVVEDIGLIVGGDAATGPPIHLTDKGEATAWEIAGLPRRLATIAPLELVKVRVVDGAVEDVPGAPREARLA